MSLPIVSFGKYKGQPVTEFIKDIKYVEWCKQQTWFKNHSTVYNIVVNQSITHSNTSSKTPEHNRLQNLFLDKTIQKNLLSKVFDLNSENKKLESLFSDEEFIECFKPNELYKLDYNPEKCRVKFEDKFNWDVNMYYSAHNKLDMTSNSEIESKLKEIYKHQYDRDQKEIYDKECKFFELQITVREMIDKKEAEYKNQFEINKKDIEEYNKNIELYNNKKKLFKINKTKEICKELHIDYMIYQTFDNASMHKSSLILDEYIINSKIKKTTHTNI